MRTALAPVKACAGEATAQLARGIQIDAETNKLLCAFDGDVVLLAIFPRCQPAQFAQPVMQRDAQGAGHVVIAGAGKAKPFRSVGLKFLTRAAREHAQSFEHSGYIGSFQTVITMLSLSMHFDQALGFEPVQVSAR